MASNYHLIDIMRQTRGISSSKLGGKFNNEERTRPANPILTRLSPFFNFGGLHMMTNEHYNGGKRIHYFLPIYSEMLMIVLSDTKLPAITSLMGAYFSISLLLKDAFNKMLFDRTTPIQAI